jgi:membrane-associated phospholipid phosphatase
MEIIHDTLNQVGELGPLLLFTTSCWLLFEKKTMLYYYIIGSIINVILNIIMKITIQQPRPRVDEETFQLMLTHFKQDVFKHGIPDIFGMPSGHAQSVVFSTAFIYLTMKNKNWLLLYSVVSLVTMGQRVVYKHHTICQVIIGSFIGLGFAFFVFYLGKRKIVGVLKQHDDDFAFV